MDALPLPLAFFLLLLSGWVNRQQQAVRYLDIPPIGPYHTRHRVDGALSRW
jgi:hypothetical protein